MRRRRLWIAGTAAASANARKAPTAQGVKVPGTADIGAAMMAELTGMVIDDLAWRLGAAETTVENAIMAKGLAAIGAAAQGGRVHRTRASALTATLTQRTRAQVEGQPALVGGPRGPKPQRAMRCGLDLGAFGAGAPSRVITR